MRNERAPSELTPDQQRAARDRRWAKARSEHWHSAAPAAPNTETHTRGADSARTRGSKPTDIPSRAPDDDE